MKKDYLFKIFQVNKNIIVSLVIFGLGIIFSFLILGSYAEANHGPGDPPNCPASSGYCNGPWTVIGQQYVYITTCGGGAAYAEEHLCNIYHIDGTCSNDGVACSERLLGGCSLSSIVSCGGGGGGGGGGSNPTVTLTANPSTVSSGGNSTLTWTVSDATSCTASGDWSGSKSTSGGSEVQTNITSNESYTLTCSNSNGSSQDSATVTLSASAPSITYDFEAGTSVPPSSDSFSGTAPVNNLDGRHLLTINGNCGSDTDPDEDRCNAVYRVDCTNDGTWDSTLNFPSVWSGQAWNRNAIDVCDYPSGGTYDMKGEVTVTHNTNSSDTTTDTDIVVVNLGSPAPSASASCSPSSQTAYTGDTVSFNGSANGESPITCTWTATGGSPSSGSSCFSFSTVYNTTGTKTVTFDVSANNGNDSDSCTVTVSDPPPQTYGLVTVRSGQGTVTSSPAGINCGGTCSASYVEDTVVTLTATPNTGWRFVGWGGDCSGTNTQCTLTINGSKNVTASFRPNLVYEEF